MKNAQNIPMKQMFWENVSNLLDVIMNNDNMGSFVLYLLHEIKNGKKMGE